MANDELHGLTPEEIEAAKRELTDFWARVEAVPESERILIDSDKFAGPIGGAIDDRTDAGTADGRE